MLGVETGFELEFQKREGCARTEVEASKVNLLGAKALPHPALSLSKHKFNRALVPRAGLDPRGHHSQER